MNDLFHGREARKRGCRECTWFSADRQDPEIGVCRAAPPRTSSTRFPTVEATEWCAGWLPVELNGTVTPVREPVAAPETPEPNPMETNAPLPEMGPGTKHSIERAWGRVA